MSRKKFTSEFKTKVAIEAPKAHKTINELSIEFGVHASQQHVEKAGDRGE